MSKRKAQPTSLYVTPQEVADALAVSVNYVYACCANKRLQAVKVGTHWRITRAAFDHAVKHGIPAAPVPRLGNHRKPHNYTRVPLHIEPLRLDVRA